MRSIVFRAMILPFVTLISTAISAPYIDLIPKYNRSNAQIMARSVAVATRANLDYAAYTANPIRFDPEKQKPKAPQQPPSIQAIRFGGALKKCVATIQETPLTKEELEAPLAWLPLMNLLWTEQKSDALQKIGSRIISEKWTDPDIFKPYQDIAALYLHKNGLKTELWVKIEFMPWVSFLKNVQDRDNDKFKEVYGELNTDTIDNVTLNTIVEWITSVYMRKVLTKEEIVDWANVLASYWYPTLNTDIVDLSQAASWPTKETEPSIRSSLKGLVFKHPAAVIRGNPYGKILYNVFLVQGESEGNAATPLPIAAQPSLTKSKILDTALSANFIKNNQLFAQEIKENDDYQVWAKKCAPLQSAFKKVLAGIPNDQMGIEGNDGWLFFRKSIDYILAPDLSLQAPDKNPLPHLVAFKQFLDRNNINMLFVAIPCKEELYPEKLGIIPTDATGRIVAPYGRKILADLQKAGIEVIDLLPLLLAVKADDTNQKEPLFQLQDTHWTCRGMEIAAAAIADRIKSYIWYPLLDNQKKSYTLFDTTFLRQGDIVERIPEADRSKYPAAELKAVQVITPEKKKYVPDPAAPIMLIGDSFTGVFELVDGKSAGIGSHIAAKTSLPIDIMTSWGGGPMIMNKMLRTRKNMLPSKRLVIYMMTVRDLYNYSQGWEKLNAE